MESPKLVRRQTATFTPKDQHATWQSARRVAMKRSRAWFVLQHGPRGAVDVPSPAIVPLLEIRHSAINIHRVTVQNRRVLVSRCRSALARREQVPRFRLCNRSNELEPLQELASCRYLRGTYDNYRNGRPTIRRSCRVSLGNRRI